MRLRKYFKYIQGIGKPYNSKGVTLTELMVSAAILAIVAGPFLGSFMTAAQNNTLSEEIIDTSNMAQRAMETIKADDASLNVTEFQELDAPYQPAAPSAYKITYSVDRVDDNVWKPAPDDEDEFNSYSLTGNSDVVKNSNVIIDVGKNNADELTINSDTETGLDAMYTLDIKASGGSNYQYTLTKDGVPADTGSFEDSEGSIDVRIQFYRLLEGTGKSLDLGIDIDSSIGKDVNFYIVDNTDSYLKITNKGGKDFYQYDGLSTLPSQTNVLYKITVNVSEKNGGRVVNQLVSYIKK